MTTKAKHIQHSYAYRQLQKTIQALVYSQKIKNPTVFIAYLQREPKTFMGTKSPDMKMLINISQVEQSNKPESPNSQQKQIKKKSKMYMDIENLLHIMRHYKTSDKIQILKEANKQNQPEHTDQITTMIRSYNWNRVYRKAQEEYEFSTAVASEDKYYNIFMRNVDDSRQKTMTKEDTTKFMIDWTTEQKIQTFILEIYSIIRMFHPKINTLYLQG